ncbi:MAG TPA: (5-formylfuran-3-yl)methyl phosphate synthase, partial [Solirubrobacteraceae bacterium]|nr:(5-formylfuran-3-yl)methyl phosphate synthase [Solirubrobacteraceae bacterium]
AGAIFGLAGQLRCGELARVDADVVGVRSAVCRSGDRAAELDSELVAAAVAGLRAGGDGLAASLAGSGRQAGVDE